MVPRVVVMNGPQSSSNEWSPELAGVETAAVKNYKLLDSQTWEATPIKIKCLPSNSFEKEYKLFLLDSQAS